MVKNPERCICDECGNSYRDKYALKSHIGKLYLRLDFTQIYSILLNLAHFFIDHEHANGLAQPLPCDQCGKLFYNPFKLKTHVKRNHVKTQCALCGDMVVANKMSYHIQQVHTRSEDRPHKCPTCGNFTQNLLQIYYKFTQIYNFFSGKGFIHANKLREHINIHTGEKPFKCQYCPSAFASAGTKAMHEKGHLGIKRKPKV